MEMAATEGISQSIESGRSTNGIDAVKDFQYILKKKKSPRKREKY